MNGLRLIIVLTVSLGAACSRDISTATHDMDNARAAIHALWEETNAALTAKDWDRYQQVWFQSPELKVIHPAQRDRIDGWEAFRERYQQLLASETEFGVNTKRVDVDISPGGDVGWAFIEADLIVNGTVSPQWYVIIAQEIDGDWRIILALDSPVPESAVGG